MALVLAMATRWLRPLKRGLAQMGWGLVLLLTWRLSWVARWGLARLCPEVLFCGRQGRCPQTGAPLVALTIDDGPSGEGSLALLDLLDGLEVPATLFLIGGQLAAAPHPFVARALAAGHGIGNHMAIDAVSARLSPGAFAHQLQTTAEGIRQAAAPLPLRLHWFRPGGGWFHRPMLRWLQRTGYRLALGSVFPFDTNHPPRWFLQRFILANAHPGAIVVLHDRSDTLAATLDTLRAVVPALKRRGYRFVTLDGLVAADG